MTLCVEAWRRCCIIPYQELLGNYDIKCAGFCDLQIIPYQELLGNYDVIGDLNRADVIIPYQELLGNYDTQTSSFRSR